jgi:hypothetical protein
MYVSGISIAFVVINLAVLIYGSVLKAWIIEYLIQSFQSELPWASCDHAWNTDTCVATGISNDGNGYANVSVMSNMTSQFDMVTYSDSSKSSSSSSRDAQILITNTTAMDVFNQTGGLTAAEEFWQ